MSLRVLPAIAGAVLTIALAPAASATPKWAWANADSIAWPAGTEAIRFLDIEGVILLEGAARGVDGRDTTGLFVLDTGAGYLVLDRGLAMTLGVADSATAKSDIDIARHPLPKYMIGALSMDGVEPVLIVDTDIVRRVTDRPVLGLLGQKPLGESAIWIDYQADLIAVLPVGLFDPETAPNPVEASRRHLQAGLSPRAVPIRFRMAGDGKVLIKARVSSPRPPRFGPWLTLVLDTGASKCVLFEEAVASMDLKSDAWPSFAGLSAPTLIGASAARLARIPAVEIETEEGPMRSEPVEFGLMRSDLQRVLSSVTGATIHGLLGHSFLKRYRVAIDYPRRVVWLDPIPSYREDRPHEFSHVGLQIERREGRVRVVGVVGGSAADKAGIRVDDELLAVDGTSTQAGDLIAIAKKLEGPPGSEITLTVRHGSRERIHRLRRRRLL